MRQSSVSSPVGRTSSSPTAYRSSTWPSGSPYRNESSESSPRCDRRPAAGKVRLAFIGRHDRQKGVDVLLDTIERFALPNIHFDIVGARVLNPADSRAEPNRPNVTFHGWLSRAETIELLANVDGVVMPSRWDAAPIVALEAMRAGLPVIGSNRGALPEIIQHGVGGYIFDLDDADALGRLLERLDRSELRRLGASARARWESEYIADKMNELTLGAYQDLLSNVGQLTPPASSRCGISSSAELQPSQ
jgi:glycosyltransferase involved in cell wall biosynthesis